jgi:Domain of unknown function (DUF427)
LGSPVFGLLLANSEQRQQRFDAQVQKLVDNGPFKLAAANGRRLRIQFNNRFIVDTTSAYHVWEDFRYPWLYVPWDDVKKDVKDDMEIVKEITHAAGGTEKKAVILKYPKSQQAGGKSTSQIIHFEQGLGKLTGLVKFEFGDMGRSLEYRPI